MALNSAQESESSPDVIRHLVLLGDALQNIDLGKGQAEDTLVPRPRNPWSRWVEGFEAARLEARFSKTRILEFYLNQVPYTERRRGVVQAARTYFDRDVYTLSRQEMLALAVLTFARVAPANTGSAGIASNLCHLGASNPARPGHAAGR